MMTAAQIATAAGGAFLVAALLTGIVRRMALARGVLDVPNSRSSHSVPTPRGGGVAIVVVTLLGLGLLAWHGNLDRAAFCALAGGGLAVAIVGLLDDRRPLRARTRLAVHFAAALWALGWLGGLPVVQLFGATLPVWVGYIIGALLIVWSLNLFNFMDGIDGIAAVEAAFVAIAAGLLRSGAAPISLAAILLGCACLGFLVWNWSPAKIFMGDAGSGFLGFVLAVFALAAAREDAGALAVWIILGGVFVVDASVTLVRRLLRRERLYQAHRSHAYQWLSRRWGSHSRVTLAALAVNVLWLGPCAWLAARSDLSAWIAVAALTPLIGVAIWAGAGRAEAFDREQN